MLAERRFFFSLLMRAGRDYQGSIPGVYRVPVDF